MALSRRDATIVMGMLARGDLNQDIAAWFGENPARVVEVANGQAFGVVPAAPAADLPPRGAVGPKARRLRAYAQDALTLLRNRGAEGIAEAITELEAGLARFDQDEA
jgi:hypothetical protein